MMMLARRSLSVLVFLVLVGAPGGVAASAETGAGEPPLSIWIEKHAQLNPDGSPTFRVHVTCGPLPGSEDFREGRAGAAQASTGASAEGGLSPDVVCDGTERVYTAGVSLITAHPFRPGPARATASVIACNVVGDHQVCVQDAAHRTVIIRGRHGA